METETKKDIFVPKGYEIIEKVNVSFDSKKVERLLFEKRDFGGYTPNELILILQKQNKKPASDEVILEDMKINPETYKYKSFVFLKTRYKRLKDDAICFRYSCWKKDEYESGFIASSDFIMLRALLYTIVYD